MVLKFPQPTPAELAEAKDFWIGLNPFWRRIVEGLIDEIDNPDLWEDYTQELDVAIQELGLSQEGEMPITASQITALGVVSYRTANMNLSNVTYTSIPFTSQESHASAGLHSTVTNNTRFTPTIEGWWEVEANVSFAANATGARILRIWKNNADEEGIISHPPTAVAQVPAINLVKKIYLLTTDYIELQARQESGGTLALMGGRSLTWGSFFFAGK